MDLPIIKHLIGSKICPVALGQNLRGEAPLLEASRIEAPLLELGAKEEISMPDRYMTSQIHLRIEAFFTRQPVPWERKSSFDSSLVYSMILIGI